ncbi:MAG: fibronectin type III domain-containing protein [Flavobacteriales bacterium]|nr:fibronectin type III domain-containing protein [Flavobacteriales bacterium]
MTIFHVLKLGLTDLTSKALVEKGRNNVDMLTGNAAFTMPAGFLARITTACDTLEQANEEVLFFGGIVNHQAKRAAESVVRDLLRELGGLVQQQSEGDEAKILSAGFEVRRRGTPVEKLGLVNNLRPLLTAFAGEVPLRWNVVAYAVQYMVMQNTEDPEKESAWQVVAYTSKTAFTATGLESGKNCWFRIQAQGRKGLQSPISQVVKARVA